MRNAFKKIISRFLKIWQTTDRTGQQVARGSFLVLFSRFFIKGLQFIRTIILARLLFPEDFGLFGMATLTMTFISIFFQHGFYSALISEKNNDEKQLSCAWTVNFLKNLLAALLIFFVGAPLAANFFHNPDVIPFIKFLSIVVFIEGWENIGVVLLNKELRFNKLFFYNIIVVFFEIATVIIAAYYLRSAWALLIGVLVSRISSLILSYIFHPFRPRFFLNFAIAKHLFQYGKWIGLAGIVTFLTGQGDSLMIGKLLDTYSLGIYSLAFALGTLPAVEIAKVLSNILFPFFSKIQNDPGLLKSSFTRLFRIIFALVIPALGGIYVLSGEIVTFIYSEKWLDMIPILPVVILIALLNTFQTIVGSLFLGVGKPRVATFVLIIQSLIMYSLIVPFVNFFGVVGAAWAVFAGLFVSQLFLFLKLRSIINLGFRGFGAILTIPVISCAAMYLLIRFFKNIFFINNYFILFFYVILGAFVYVLTLFIIDGLSGKKYYKSWLWLKGNI